MHHMQSDMRTAEAAIGPDANKGQDGWVYKAGDHAATAGAGDPAGPFGSGRLKTGSRVTWFYCHMNAKNHSCQRTLDLATKSPAPGQLRVHVTAYDDRGQGKVSTGASTSCGTPMYCGSASISINRG